MKYIPADVSVYLIKERDKMLFFHVSTCFWLCKAVFAILMWNLTFFGRDSTLYQLKGYKNMATLCVYIYLTLHILLLALCATTKKSLHWSNIKQLFKTGLSWVAARVPGYLPARVGFFRKKTRGSGFFRKKLGFYPKLYFCYVCNFFWIVYL